MNFEFPTPDFGSAPKMSSKSIPEGLMPSRDLVLPRGAGKKAPPIIHMPPLRRLHTDSAKPESVVNLNTKRWVSDESAPWPNGSYDTIALEDEFLEAPKLERYQVQIVTYERHPEDGGFDSESDSDYLSDSGDSNPSAEDSNPPKKSENLGKPSNIEPSLPSLTTRPSYFHYQGIILASSLEPEDFFFFHTPIDPRKPRTQRMLEIHYSKNPSSSFPPPRTPSLSIPITTITIRNHGENARLAAALSSFRPTKNYVQHALLALVTAHFIGEKLANACDGRMQATISKTNYLISKLEESGYSLKQHNRLGIDVVLKVLVLLAQAGIDNVNKAEEVLDLLQQVREMEASGRYPGGDAGCSFS